MRETDWTFDADTARLLKRALYLVAAGAGYFIAGAIGTAVAIPPSGFAIIWPGTAYLIAILLVVPTERWWPFLTSIVVAHFIMEAVFAPGAPLALNITQITGNIGLAIATVLLVRATNPQGLRFDTFRSTLRFIVVAAIVAPAIGNALILSGHLLAGRTHDIWLSWRQWMLASVFSTITIPPVLLSVLDRGAFAENSLNRRALRELAILCLILFAASYFAFGFELRTEWWPGLLLMFLPLMLWAAVRLNVAATCLSLLVFCAAIMLRALHGQGPFAVDASPASLVSLQVFMTTLSIPIVLLAALTQDSRRTATMLKRTQERIDVVATSTDTGLWQWHEPTRQLWMTESCRWLLGIGPEADLTPVKFLEIVHEDDRAKIEATLQAMLTSRDVEAVSEFRIVRPNGEPRWFSVRTHTEFGEDGAPLRISGVFRDITERVKAQQKVERLGQRLLDLQEKERQKIAEELHEATAQHLVAASLNVAVLKRRIKLEPDTESVIEEIRTSIQQAINELRTFKYILRPTGLDKEGLQAVLRRHVDGFSRQTGLRVSLEASPDADELPLEYQRTMLRIVQECLLNVHRHANAKRASVRLRRVADEIHVIIGDDGKGMNEPTHFRHKQLSEPGVGLAGITARVRQLGGRIDIRSNTRGTAVHVVIPAPGAERAKIVRKPIGA